MQRLKMPRERERERERDERERDRDRKTVSCVEGDSDRLDVGTTRELVVSREREREGSHRSYSVRERV